MGHRQAGYGFTLVFLIWLALAWPCSAKDLMIVAPHPDDEAISCAGVIKSAVDRGDNVKLVLVTNGDFNGGRTKARARLIETINAMDLLGLGPEEIIYLGYGDGIVLLPAFHRPGAVFVSTDGKTRETSGFEDLGIRAFHKEAFGTPARFTRSDILSDFQTVLATYQPQEIFIPSPMESHRDHSATGLFLYEALRALKTDMDYSPVIYEYMIYRTGLPQAPLDPSAPVTNETADMDATPYPWEDRQVMPVPESMVRPFDSGHNLKFNVLREYKDNTQDKFDRFIRSQEIFWRRDTDNLAFRAKITVSSHNAATGQEGSKAADGIILGAPYKSGPPDTSLHRHEWATQGQLSGAWIKLSWPLPQRINRIRLYDRPNTDDQILSGTLSFSDGTAMKVGPLPNHGGGHAVTFPAKDVHWVRLTVDQAKGSDIGLSEFEVFR